MTLTATRAKTGARGTLGMDSGGQALRAKACDRPVDEDDDDACVVEHAAGEENDAIGAQAPGVDGAARTTGPGVPGADGEKGAGGGRHPGLGRRQPDAIAQRTLFLATSSVVASAASYTRGMPEPHFQWPASSMTSSGKLSWRIDVV